MRWEAWVLAAVAWATGPRLAAQPALRIEGPSRAEPTVLLRAAARDPHDIVVVDSSRRPVFPRGTRLPRTTLIIGGDASIGAVVRGDVIVVGGDLYLRPGAAIDGRAVAIGGGVYGSTLAFVRDGVHANRDVTFDATASDGVLVLRYRRLGAGEPWFELPLLEGLRIPSYERVDGASVPWGPILRPSRQVEVEPLQLAIYDRLLARAEEVCA